MLAITVYSFAIRCGNLPCRERGSSNGPCGYSEHDDVMQVHGRDAMQVHRRGSGMGGGVSLGWWGWWRGTGRESRQIRMTRGPHDRCMRESDTDLSSPDPRESPGSPDFVGKKEKKFISTCDVVVWCAHDPPVSVLLLTRCCASVHQFFLARNFARELSLQLNLFLSLKKKNLISRHKPHK